MTRYTPGRTRPVLFRSPLFALCLLCLLCFAPSQAQHAQNTKFDFYRRGPYRQSVPKPSAILGYDIGDTHSTYRDQERVITAIATAAKDRVRVIEYGKSVEGRPLRLLIISAPENIARLETLRSQNLKLVDPRTLNSSTETDAILKTAPAITWINHCIHGNESASFETAMWTLYTLAASESTEVRDTLQKSIVILNPVFNPDGHERFAVWNNSLAVGSPESFSIEKGEPWAIIGRFNHYRFDMNRDKLAQSQPETRQETAAYLRWYPHVFVDQHGQPETYFFPPNAPATHIETDIARVNRWTDIFGRANASAFDKYGWQYVTRETFDLFYPGYLDSWTTLAGAIGMTYETDGGGNLARRRNDDTIITLRDAAAHHFESALATIFAAARNRGSLVKDFLAYRRSAIESTKTEKRKFVLFPPVQDANRRAALAELLTRIGVEVRLANGPVRTRTAHSYLAMKESPGIVKEFPAQTLIIDLAQPQGRMARAFLEPAPLFLPEFVKEQVARWERNEKRNENERREDYEFYDVTAWSLPYAFDLEASWTEDAELPATELLKADAQGHLPAIRRSGAVSSLPAGKTPVAYVFRYESEGAALLALHLLQEDYRLAVLTKAGRIGGADYAPGTLIAFTNRNPETLPKRLETLAKESGVAVTAVSTAYSDEASVGLGSEAIVSLKKPSILVVADESTSTSDYGAAWYLFERVFGIKFTPIRLNRLRSIDLSRFNVIVFPEGFGYAGTLGKAGVDSLREWMGKGGVVLGLGTGGAWFLDKEVSFSSAVAVGSDEKPVEPSKTSPTPKSKRPQNLPGSIFRAQIDRTHFLGYGYTSGEIAVPLSGSTFLKPTKQGSNVVTFGKGPLHLSGFLWPGNTEELLANTAYVIDEPVGRGHAILYLSDPTFRALWPGLNRLLLNGILFAPSRAPLSSP